MRIAGRIHLIGGGTFGLSHYGDANVFALDCGDQSILIDAGCGISTQILLANLENESLPPVTHLLLTHSHWDHARGTAQLKKALDLKVVAHPAARNQLTTHRWKSSHVTQMGVDLVSPADIDLEVGDGDVIEVGDQRIEVLATPGHTADGLCFAVRQDGALSVFTGDTLMGEGQLGTFSADTDAAALKESIVKLDNLDVDAVFPGHHAFTVRGGGRQTAIARQVISGAWSVNPGYIAHLPTWWLERDNRLAHDWHRIED